ncbi:hypothetical protein KZ870_34975, partial [Pseudomonas aeruginosa]|nr:hypothetical protein [Pseudomonas aeruginosa]
MGPSWSMGLPGVVRQAPVSGKPGAGRTSAADSAASQAGEQLFDEGVAAGAVEVVHLGTVEPVSSTNLTLPQILPVSDAGDAVSLLK